jgi:hypothetical protein
MYAVCTTAASRIRVSSCTQLAPVAWAVTAVQTGWQGHLPRTCHCACRPGILDTTNPLHPARSHSKPRILNLLPHSDLSNLNRSHQVTISQHEKETGPRLPTIDPEAGSVSTGSRRYVLAPSSLAEVQRTTHMMHTSNLFAADLHQTASGSSNDVRFSSQKTPSAGKSFGQG